MRFLNMRTALWLPVAAAGIEIPAERFHPFSEDLSEKAVQQKKPVIIATQMLHSMIDNPQIHGKVSDVATAIYDRMEMLLCFQEKLLMVIILSRSVKVMSKIAIEVEASKDRRNDLPVPRLDNETSAFLAETAILASEKLKSALLSLTHLQEKLPDILLLSEVHCRYLPNAITEG